MGKGLPRDSTKYGMTTCFIVLDLNEYMKSNNIIWYRLYPINEKWINIPILSLLKAKIREFVPEKHRHESFKINELSFDYNSEHLEILNKLTFRDLLEDAIALPVLHGNVWRKKSIALQIFNVSEFKKEKDYEHKTFVWKLSGKCTDPFCDGHKFTINDSIKIDSVGRHRMNKGFAPDEKLNNKKYYILIGTHAQHPYRWLLIQSFIETVLEFPPQIPSNLSYGFKLKYQ